MKIDLYRLTQNDNDGFREMVREYADSYLEMLTFWDMCMMRVDTMREQAMSFSMCHFDNLDLRLSTPADVYVDDEDKAREIILDEFNSALRKMFNDSLEYELDHSTDGRVYIQVLPIDSELDNVYIHVVSLHRNEVIVAYRSEVVPWCIGDVEDVYMLWRALKNQEMASLVEFDAPF